jgi:Domain of unknown function (DUF4232)
VGPNTSPMRTTIAGLALLAAVALSGCGGSGATTTTDGARASASAGAPAGANAGSTSSTAAATTSTGAGQPSTATTGSATSTGSDGGASVGGPSQQCQTASLSLSFLGGQGATGHGELGFSLRNNGSACSTGGYPGIQFLDQSGAPLPTTPQHTTSDFFGHLPLQELTVLSGQSISFRLGVSHGEASSAGCATVYGLQVIPPNNTTTLTVKIPGGASECGATTVSPVQPGLSAYP